MKQLNGSGDVTANAGKIMVLTCAVLAFAVMNGTMFNVAIPDIAETFELSPSQVSWVITSFTTLFAIGTLVYGKLADFFPIRRLYTISLTLFSLGSLIGFLSPNFETLIAARVLQALGAAAIPPLSFIVPLRFFQEGKGRLFGYIASTIAFASGMGPIIGGTIGGALDWRYIFLVSMASIFAIPLLRKWFPDEPRKKGSIDYLGAALVAATVTSLLFAITSANWIALMLFTVFAALMTWRVNSTPHPFIDPNMLKIKKYSVTVATGYLGNTILFGLIFLLPIMLRELYGLSMTQIGLILFPGAIVSGLIGKWIGKVIDTRGGQPIVKYGLLFTSAGALIISTFSGSGPLLIAFGLFIAYLGFPLIQSGTADLVSSNLSDRQNGVGMGLFNLLNFLAGAFSSAIFGKMLDSGQASFQLNPLSGTGENLIYSNIFVIFTVLGLLSLLFFSTLYKQRTPEKAVSLQ